MESEFKGNTLIISHEKNKKITDLLENFSLTQIEKLTEKVKGHYDLIIIESEDETYLSTSLSVLKPQTKSFKLVYSKFASENPILRQTLFGLGCNMVTSCLESTAYVIQQITNQITAKGKLNCPICGIEGLTEDSLWYHLPLYHVNLDDELIDNTKCPSCSKTPKPNLQVHYRNSHGLVAKGEVHRENSNPGQLYSFALVVVYRKSDNKYLLVQEFASSGFWLPGGRVDAAEDLQEAAIRETKEEAGVDVRLTGVLTLQMKAKKDYTRMRVIFFAEPLDDEQKPKSVPDYESVGASYFSYEEIRKVKLRGSEPLIWIDYVEKGGMVYPMEIFSNE
jgi:ADP-ribose pyrophosphatase YjhB (NUDIX family)